MSALLDPNDPNSPTFSLKTGQSYLLVGEPSWRWSPFKVSLKLVGCRQWRDVWWSKGSSSGVPGKRQWQDYLLHFTTDQVQPLSPTGELRVVVTSVSMVRPMKSEPHHPGGQCGRGSATSGRPASMKNIWKSLVDITARKPGYHQLSANWYDERSGKPVVHLECGA